MVERIYAEGIEGELTPMEEQRFSTEEELEELLANHPELLDGEQICLGDPRRGNSRLRSPFSIQHLKTPA